MNLALRALGMAIVISLVGCGPSYDKLSTPSVSKSPLADSVSTGNEEPQDLSVNPVNVKSQAASPDILSPRRVANLPQDIAFSGEDTAASKVSFADLDLHAILGSDDITEDDVKRLPNSVKLLDGKRVRIRGYMYPTFEETGITSFVLTSNLRLTNFGKAFRAYEMVLVDLIGGTTTENQDLKPIEVIGVFELKPSFEDGRPQLLYSLIDAVVLPAKEVVAPK